MEECKERYIQNQNDIERIKLLAHQILISSQEND